MSPVALEITDGIAHVVLDEPERGNPFDLEFCLQFSRVATACDESGCTRRSPASRAWTRTDDAWTGVTEVAARRKPRFLGR